MTTKSVVNPRQGKRKKDKWGPCRLCGVPATLRCARCHHWRCGGLLTGWGMGHVRLRRAPKQIGVYHVVCWPRCIRRKTELDVAPIGGALLRPPSEFDPDPMEREETP